MQRRALLYCAGIALTLAGSALWTGCSQAPAPESEPVVAVQAAPVAQKTIQDVITAEAVLYARTETTIVPKISAPVEKFYVNRGSRVRAGQLLAQLENHDLQAAVEQAKGAYDQAQAAYITSTEENLPAETQAAELNVKETQQAMEASRMVYESRQKLFEAGAISRNLMEESHVNYVQADNQYQIAIAHLNALQKVGQSAELKTAAGQLASAQGQYNAALANLHYSEIRSPIDGVVTDRPLYEGQMATAGAPLMTVMDLSKVIGRAYVSPQQAAELHVSDRASLVLGDEQGEAPAQVAVVSSALDPNSTTVQVWVEADNPAGQLKPGSTASLRIIARTVKAALVVPVEAVLTDPDGATSVMVIGKDQHAHQTAVKTGIQEGGETQILSGVNVGEQVVSEGAYALPDGTKVQIAKGATVNGNSAE